MNRRDAIKMGAAAAAGSMFGSELLAASKPLKILILGGTGFIGPHFVKALRDHGHALTLFNRGKRAPDMFPDIETLIGDRNGQIDALKNRDWDVVIDDSGYLLKHVRLTTELLKDHTQYYLYISSISAYADFKTPNIDEDYALAELKDPETEEIMANYGGLKAGCEKIVEAAFGQRCSIVRPTYIVGPGDHTDRFTYWPVRVSRGGEMLVPGSASDPMQFIDVRDLAEFVRLCVEKKIPGRYNACNPPRSVTMGMVLDTSKRISKSDTRYVWVSEEFLEAQKLLDSNEIPIWSPPSGEWIGAAQVSCARAVAKGLKFRDPATTIADTLAWHATRPLEQQQKLRAGFTPEREAELLKLWKSQLKA
ncbi:MAG: NAD-dependent epimerase/dehydratase family protein [Povalibacter sp.]